MNMSKFFKNTFVNREYSWLQFNERVLNEALAEDNPLLERCKFLSIFSSNLDEFFMVRVGTLINEMQANPEAKENKTGLRPVEQLHGIYRYTKKLYQHRMKIAKKIFACLKNEKVTIVNSRVGSKRVSKRFEKYFQKTMLPLLDPMVLDNKHPLIHLENLKIYVILHMESNGKKFFGILPVPQKCERLIVNETASGTQLMTSEELLYCFADRVFSKYNVLEKALVRLTRNADMDTEMFSVDLESEYDFSKLMKKKVRSRLTSPSVRLELSSECKFIRDFLCKSLNMEAEQCFTIYYFFDYKFLFSIDKYFSEEHAARLKYQPLKNRLVKLANPDSVIASVLENDMFLSYPFDSMDTFLDLLDEASTDPRVASIKVTVYRVDKQSRIVEALRRAQRNGKEVTVIIELTARFDEENNLYLTEVLKDANCTVVYGIGNYKVHSKIMLIVLKDGENISYITHLGTGNYKETTSRQYTDVNIITANQEIGEDAAVFFRNIAMGVVDFNCAKLLVAPQSLKKALMQKIREQTALAEAGKPAKIVCKMNSLTDLDFIKEFVRASAAGVKIKLIVRGICCLLPGVPGKTENIEVKSIIGRFLEHSRIYCFGDKDPEIYISSADLMTRNVSRRVEVAAPVIDRQIRKRIGKMLDIMLADNEKASYLAHNGKYIRKAEEGKSSQQFFIDNAV
jgi:polyphosphate kinase